MKAKQNGISRKAFLGNLALGGLPIILSPKDLFNGQLFRTAANGFIPQVIPLSTGWKFRPHAGTIARQSEQTVTIPHCVSNLSWQDWDPASWQALWQYQKSFELPAAFLNERVFVHFDGVMVGAVVRINGQELPSHYGGYLPFEYEITPYVKKENLLEVMVDARWSNVPPQGSVKGAARVDYLEAGGIYRPVSLKIVPKIFIQDVFAKPVDVLNPGRNVSVKCTLNTSVAPVKNAALEVTLVKEDKTVAATRTAVIIDKTGTKEVAVTLSDLKNIRLWDIDTPHLYGVIVRLYIDNSMVHCYKERVGFREAAFTTDGFFLNGNRLQLFGLNRHEIFPYVGGAMPARVMKNDALILKKKLNCNMVRCSHYPQSTAFLDACDELGLMVWEEVPGWGYLGDEQWKELLVQNTRDMVLRDRNHPSIIIWGVRVNESPNDPVLYRRTKAIAKNLDGSRPTSGSMTPDSMKTWKEDWHQDVLAFDDYHADPDGNVGINEPEKGVPYMLAEAVGQFNYAKRKNFDSYYRRSGTIATMQHQAIWHAQAHQKARLNKHNCGVIAWCAFEYASLVNHYRTVKYPGVADFFRVPKLGASFYMAQTDPLLRPVIEPDFYWDFGRETPHGPGKNVAIFSNCDRLELYINDTLHGSLQPDIKNFYNLKYPPFFGDLEWKGTGLPELKIVGYLKGKRLLSRRFSADRQKDRLRMIADDPELTGDGVDATRVEFGITDAYGNYRIGGKGIVQFQISGPGQLIGDNPFNLNESGGVAAVWIRTQPGGSGKIVVTALHPELGKQKVEIGVLRAKVKSTLV